MDDQSTDPSTDHLAQPSALHETPRNHRSEEARDLERFLERVHQEALSRLRHRGIPVDTAEEIVQEAMAAHAKAEVRMGPSTRTFRAALFYTILARRAADWFRAQNRKPEIVSIEAIAEPTQVETAEPSEQVDALEAFLNRLERKIDLLQVMRAIEDHRATDASRQLSAYIYIRRLTPENRRVLLHAFFNTPHADVVAEFGRDNWTVDVSKQRRKRAMLQFVMHMNSAHGAVTGGQGEARTPDC